MKGFVLGTLAILTPILAGIHVALYDFGRDKLTLLLRDNRLAAGLVTSLLINIVGIAVICFASWLVWRLLIRRKYARIHDFYWQHTEELMVYLRQLRVEINAEIARYIRLAEKGNYDFGRWERLQSSYDIFLTRNNLLAIDNVIERYLQDNNTVFSVVRELREPIIKGLRRVQEILGAGERNVNTIHRAEEVVADIHDRHLDQFRRCLATL